jgi:hypothetical protein
MAGEKKRAPRKRNASPAEPDPPAEQLISFAAEPELIVISMPDAGIRATPSGPVSITGAGVQELARTMERTGFNLVPLFGREDRISANLASMRTSSEVEVPDLARFYRVEAPMDALESAAEELLALDIVEAAYVKPPTTPPLHKIKLDREFILRDWPILDWFNMTDDFSSRQGYLDAAPGGIDARWAWTQPGGLGDGVRVIDIEGNWRFTHEDLTQNQGGVVGTGTLQAGVDWRDHGTAVLGEISGDSNLIGIVGIAPNANIRAISHGTIGSAAAIRQGADLLSPGDLLLLEMHRPGPLHNFAERDDQEGYIAVEWWEDDFAAIRYAVARGVIVIEAAGNGAQNLDANLYQTRPAGFPTAWTNPFRRTNRDSGAVMVGAGAPPPGTHGLTWGADRSRLGFSNWGALIDAQGWGSGVTTTGYGDLQGGTDEDLWYTDDFGGTSSASPIVTGAVALVQSSLKAHGRIPLSPARARELLRATGSAQQDEPGRPATQRIGNRPNLRQLIPRSLQNTTFTGVQFTGSLSANQTKRWFTFGWPAHWHVYWTVIPTIPRVGVRQIKWKVQVERASDSTITYWIEITNLTSSSVNIEGRFAVLGF